MLSARTAGVTGGGVRTKGPVQKTPVTNVENRNPALYAQQMAGKVYRIAWVPHRRHRTL